MFFKKIKCEHNKIITGNRFDYNGTRLITLKCTKCGKTFERLPKKGE